MDENDKILENQPAEEISSADNNEGSAGKGITFIYDTVSIFATAIVIIAFIFTFIARFVGVSGASMNPTLNDEDWLLVSAINTNIKQGDIVISTQPNAFNEPIVKRVIAKGGQTVDIDFTKGVVYVDGEALQEEYTAAPTYTSEGVTFPLVVPEGKLFLMGDNRNDSTDSRSPAIGCVDERYILGVVRYRLIPQFTKY
ncbi:MAG: signal peptidase I [Clostridia bacterium]|nr:signal peptidase I [Clostridia bacterium]